MKLKFCLFFVLLFFSLQNILSKDIYVKAKNRGNGSKANPYSSISDALNMGAYAGDVIHVTEGIYYGEGGSGKWVIKVNDLTIVGGYKSDFSERNPWKYQSILVRGMDSDLISEAKKREHDKKWGLDMTPTKARYNGKAMIYGEGNSSNTIIDGFIIDGYTRNAYKSNGDLKTDIGPIGSPLISFNKPGCKVLNCVVLNSAGPGIQMFASGDKDNPQTWQEISNCIILNTLMEAIDFRAGDMDPKNAPNGGCALIKNNSVAFVWPLNGEGYGILIGRQTRLTIENNIFAFATDYALNNGFGNDKASLIDNVFFNNMGGVYRYWASGGSGSTVVEDDPTLLEGKQANKLYYLSKKSKGNVTIDPKFKPDPDFFEKFTNQIKSEGGGKVVWDEVNQWRSIMGLPLIGSSGTGKVNFAPIYEHDYMLLFSTLPNGAKNDVSRLSSYSSKSSSDDKDYKTINYQDLKNNIGKDVSVKVKFYSSYAPSSYYIDGITRDTYICYRSSDQSNFFYIQNGSEALEIIKDGIKDGIEVLVSGKVYDISAAIKSSGKLGFVVEMAEEDD